MSADDDPPFADTKLRLVPHASAKAGSSLLAWADGGNPALLDTASQSIFDLFVDGVSPKEIAADLEAVFGLDSGVAMRAAFNTAYSLKASGLVLPEGEAPVPAWSFHYPPPGST